MRRRKFIGLLGAGFLAPVAGKAQQAGRTYRLGVLMPHPRNVPINVAFLEEFRRHVTGNALMLFRKAGSIG